MHIWARRPIISADNFPATVDAAAGKNPPGPDCENGVVASGDQLRSFATAVLLHARGLVVGFGQAVWLPRWFVVVLAAFPERHFHHIALVWLGFVATRLVFPENKFLQISVPALIAFIPQTAFYSIQNDVLSPLCFGAAFICLVKLLRAETPNVRFGIFTGLALAATFLTKISNLPLLAVSALAVLFKVAQLAKAGKFRAAFPSLLALALCAALPMATWLLWCKHTFGDFSGTAAKIQFLGWTHKPFSEWGHHPIFTPHGLWTFLSGLMATFWQGEFLWHRQPLDSPGCGHDLFCPVYFSGRCRPAESLAAVQKRDRAATPGALARFRVLHGGGRVLGLSLHHL